MPISNKKLNEVIDDFVSTQDNNFGEEWYGTKRELVDSVMYDFKTFFENKLKEIKQMDKENK